MMEIKPVKTKADYRVALKEIESLMSAKLNTPQGQRLDVLATLVEAYEAKHHPLDLPDPVEAIKFRMEQMGLTPKDLAPMVGRLNRVYEILNRTRPLTLKMIWQPAQGTRHSRRILDQAAVRAQGGEALLWVPGLAPAGDLLSCWTTRKVGKGTCPADSALHPSG